METFIRILVFVSIYLGLFTMSFYLVGFLERRKIKDKGPIKLPFVSIIIPAYNEEVNLEKTVETALSLEYPKNKFEVLIIDDGSKDGTWNIAQRMAKNPQVKAFTKTNGGKGSALNLGIKKAIGELVVSFDADSMVNKDALIKMIPYFKDPQVMAVTPAMKVYKPRGLLQRIQAIEYDQGIFLRKAFSNFNAVHVTPGPFSAYRKEFFEKHGGYDEHNITEDMEIAMRIQSLNYKIANSMYSVVYTVAPNQLGPLTKQRRRWYFGMVKNLWKYRYMFSKKYGELGVMILPLAVSTIFITMIVTFYYLINGLIEGLKQASLYSSVGFDFISNFKYKSYLISLNIQKLFSEGIILFAVFFFVGMLLMLILVNKKVRSVDKPISTFISYLFFMFFYSLLFTIWWTISIVYSITHKQIKWK